jgi:antitoxin (DNA-binding transcriptional repressor) of toxin-antitoxin stability system
MAWSYRSRTEHVSEPLTSVQAEESPSWADVVRRAERGTTVAMVAHGEHVAVPLHASTPAEACDAAEHGQVIYLTRNGQPVAAIVPAGVAAAGAAAVEALEDAEDLVAAHAAMAEGGELVPAEKVWAELDL